MHATATGTALLRAIVTNPDEDTPRLVYADWLDENGEAHRARTIRHQIAFRGGVGEWSADVLNDSERGFSRFFDLPLTSVRFRRGFVDEVRLTTAAFLGGPCGRCEGRGDDGGHEYDRGMVGECNACRGAGRTPALAAAIFREHPVTKVVLTDKRPAMNAVDWEWMLLDSGGRASLPECVYSHLRGFHLRGFHIQASVGLAKYYPTANAALDALSPACVAYGREAARRLPPGGE